MQQQWLKASTKSYEGQGPQASYDALDHMLVIHQHVIITIIKATMHYQYHPHDDQG